MEISLHLGAHRTATTSFQSMLWNNRAQLARAGITPWTPKRTRDGLLDGLVRHPMRVSLDDTKRGQRSIGRIQLELARLANAGQEHLVISEENLLGTMMNNVEDRAFYPYLIERMSRYAPAFDGYDLRIGLGIRSYEDYWASSLGFAIRRGHAAPDADFLDRLVTQTRHWRGLIRDVAYVFPQAKIEVWCFEQMAGRPRDVLSLLLDREAPKGLATGGEWLNRSVPMAEIAELLTIRGEALLNRDDCNLTGRWMPFDEDQRAVLRAEYRRDLTWLRDGAEGLATYHSGRKSPAARNDEQRKLRIVPKGAVPIGGLSHGIQERLG